MKRGGNNMPQKQIFSPEMSLLDAVSLHKAAEAVFRSYDAQAGVCLLCSHLFDSIGDVAGRFGFDLAALLEQLESAVAAEETYKET